MYDYYLGDYKYKVSNNTIYKRWWWFIYQPIEFKIKSYWEGVQKTNEYALGLRSVPEDDGSWEWFIKYERGDKY